jgi:hypothetical protein
MALWTPLTFALEASSALSRVLSFGAAGVGLLVFRIAVTGLGVAAGRALSAGRHGAVALTRAWLLLDAAAATVTFGTPYFPDNRVPGTKWQTLTLILVFNGMWWVYLRRSRRIRAVWPE